MVTLRSSLNHLAKAVDLNLKTKSLAVSVPKEYVPAIQKGMEEALLGGVIAGYEVIDVKVESFDGSYHEVDSNEMAFKIAGSMAVRNGVKKAGPSHS